MAKEFTGNGCMCFILLLCGVIPGVLYYFIKRKEIKQNTIVINNQNIQEGKT